MYLLLLLTTIQAWFFSSLIWGVKKQKQRSDYVLAAWLFLIGLHTLIYFLMHEQGIYNVYVAMLNVAFPFLQGPLLLLYLITKTKPEGRVVWSYLFHFLPFFIFISYQSIKYHLLVQEPSDGSQHVFIGFFEDFNIFGIFFIISLPIYLIICFIKTTSAKGINRSNLIWVRLLIIFVGGIWLSSLFSLWLPEFVNHQNQIKFNSFIFISLTGLVYFISYFGFKENLFATDIPKIVNEKYKKSKIHDDEVHKIWSGLEAYMQTKEPFLEPELDLSKLALQMEVSPNKLSQVINTESGLNFYDYLNRYRIEKIKKLMLSDTCKHYSILAIAFEAGFTSKATFNRVFKKFENCTPSEYRKQYTN